MNRLNTNSLIGYSAGIITGVTYGLNPLFAVPLMKAGAAIETILFFRYGLSVIFLLIFLLISNRNLRISWKQAGVLSILGLLYTSSSIFLFEAYNYISSGLATTLIFLYPVIVAIIMLFLKVIPTLKVWIAILVTFVGVIIMTHSDSTQTIHPTGVLLSLGSALVYAIFIVIINRSKIIENISNSILTFYALSVGTIVFLAKILISETPISTGLDNSFAWINLIGLAIFPTVVSTATLALSTRKIGATKASVLGVFEPITAILSAHSPSENR